MSETFFRDIIVLFLEETKEKNMESSLSFS